MKRETEEWLKIAREEYKSAMVLLKKGSIEWSVTMPNRRWRRS